MQQQAKDKGYHNCVGARCRVSKYSFKFCLLINIPCCRKLSFIQKYYIPTLNYHFPNSCISPLSILFPPPLYSFSPPLHKYSSTSLIFTIFPPSPPFLLKVLSTENREQKRVYYRVEQQSPLQESHNWLKIYTSIRIGLDHQI